VRTADLNIPRTIPSHLTIDGPIADQPTNGKTTAADEFSGRTISSTYVAALWSKLSTDQMWIAVDKVD